METPEQIEKLDAIYKKYDEAIYEATHDLMCTNDVGSYLVLVQDTFTRLIQSDSWGRYEQSEKAEYAIAFTSLCDFLYKIRGITQKRALESEIIKGYSAPLTAIEGARISPHL